MLLKAGVSLTVAEGCSFCSGGEGAVLEEQSEGMGTEPRRTLRSVCALGSEDGRWEQAWRGGARRVGSDGQMARHKMYFLMKVYEAASSKKE